MNNSTITQLGARETIDPKHETTTIIVNGQEKTVEKKRLSYLEVVRLAFDAIDENTIYTVTYKKGPDSKQEGTMVDGDVVTIKNRMIFNVTPTGKS